MGIRSPYAIFLNLVVALRKTHPDQEFIGCDEVLAFVAEKTSGNQTVRITDLVQYSAFGTGPTVHRKCKLLISRGLLVVDEDPDDKRANMLIVSPSGWKYLETYTKMMKDAFEKAAT